MKLSEAISLLEAKGPSREADGMIWCASTRGRLEFRMWDGAGCVYIDTEAPQWDKGLKHIDASRVRKYTDSVDDALSFAKNTILEGDDGSRLIDIFTKATNRLAEKYDWKTSKATLGQQYELAISICIVVLQEMAERERQGGAV